MEGSSAPKRRCLEVRHNERIRDIMQRFFLHVYKANFFFSFYININVNVHVWTYLTEINLSNSFITNLPRSFGDLLHLQQLNLSHNSLGSYNIVDWSWIRQIGIKNALKDLNLSYNSLSMLPIDLGYLSRIAILNLSHNSLGSYNTVDWSWIRQPAIRNNLYSLNLSNNSLSMLPIDLGHLSRIAILNLSHNSLGSYNTVDWSWIRQPAIKNNLHSLNLSNNSLTSLPIALGDLFLFELNLSHNSLGSYNIVNWSWIRQPAIKNNLHSLNLSNNLLTSLPIALGDLFLFDLNLSHNSLGSYNTVNWSWIRQPAIKNNLHSLNLSNNLLTDLPRDLGDLPRLVYLFLSHNCFGSCEKYNWHFIRQTTIKNTLTFLDVSYNLLTELPLYIGRLIALTNLNVSHNMLECLPHTIGNISQLRFLDVSCNRLLYLSEELFFLNELELNISENPFSVEAFHKIMDNRIKTLQELSCQTMLNRRISYEEDKIMDIIDKMDRCADCKKIGGIYVKRIYNRMQGGYNNSRIINTTINEQVLVQAYYCYTCSYNNLIIER